jgi:hypothetical protein
VVLDLTLAVLSPHLDDAVLSLGPPSPRVTRPFASSPCSPATRRRPRHADRSRFIERFLASSRQSAVAGPVAIHANLSSAAVRGALRTDQVQVRTVGNVLAATALRYGMAAEELDPQALAEHDPAMPVSIGIRAIRR